MVNLSIMKYFLFVLGACSFFFASNLNAGISYKSVEEETITFVYTAAGIKFSGKFVIKRSQFDLNFVEKEKSKIFCCNRFKKKRCGVSSCDVCHAQQISLVC